MSRGMDRVGMISISRPAVVSSFSSALGLLSNLHTPSPALECVIRPAALSQACLHFWPAAHYCSCCSLPTPPLLWPVLLMLACNTSFAQSLLSCTARYQAVDLSGALSVAAVPVAQTHSQSACLGANRPPCGCQLPFKTFSALYRKRNARSSICHPSRWKVSTCWKHLASTLIPCYMQSGTCCVDKPFCHASCLPMVLELGVLSCLHAECLLSTTAASCSVVLKVVTLQLSLTAAA